MGEVADVPPGVVTVTSTIPLPAGEKAVICVDEFTSYFDASAEPKCTAETDVKFRPVMITFVPPLDDPEVRDRLVTTGAGTGIVE